MDWFYGTGNFTDSQDPATWSLDGLSTANTSATPDNTFATSDNNLKVVKTEPLETTASEDKNYFASFMDKYQETDDVKPYIPELHGQNMDYDFQLYGVPVNDEDLVEEKVVIKNGQQGICTGCKQTQKIYVRSMCRACYRNTLKKRLETDEWKKQNYKNCANCQEHCKIEARGLCRPCYITISKRSKEELKKFPTKQKKKIVCNGCGKKRAPYAQDLCRACYVKSQKSAKTNSSIKAAPSGQVVFQTADTIVMLEGTTGLNISPTAFDAFMQEVHKIYGHNGDTSQSTAQSQQEVQQPAKKEVTVKVEIMD